VARCVSRVPPTEEVAVHVAGPFPSPHMPNTVRRSRGASATDIGSAPTPTPAIASTPHAHLGARDLRAPGSSRYSMCMSIYRLHDTTGEDLGLLEHPAPNLEPGDVVVLLDGREGVVTARVEAKPGWGATGRHARGSSGTGPGGRRRVSARRLSTQASELADRRASDRRPREPPAPRSPRCPGAPSPERANQSDEDEGRDARK
jgi:hypothetical protein